MSEENKSTPTKEVPSAPSPSAPASAGGGQNGKGDAPRNCFSDKFRSNFDAINWGKK